MKSLIFYQSPFDGRDVVVKSSEFIAALGYPPTEEAAIEDLLLQGTEPGYFKDGEFFDGSPVYYITAGRLHEAMMRLCPSQLAELHRQLKDLYTSDWYRVISAGRKWTVRAQGRSKKQPSETQNITATVDDDIKQHQAAHLVTMSCQQEELPLELPPQQLYSFPELAHILSLPGIGSVKLVRLLMEKKFIYKVQGKGDIRPYQRYLDSGLFQVVEHPYEYDDDVRIGLRTKITQKGVDWFKKNLTV